MTAPTPPTRITMVCTGNAARSVMAALLLRDRLGPDTPFEVASAGTLVLPDQPMSIRTRAALARHGLADPWHRSRQLGPADVAASTLLLAMEPSHLVWMKRRLPEALPLTGMLKRVVRELPDTPGETLAERVAGMGLAERPVESWEEIVDPDTGEQGVFDHCIDELAVLIAELTITLGELAR